MSGDSADKNQPRLPSWRPRPAGAAPSSIKGPSSLASVPTDDIDDAWASAESPKSEERAKPPSELPKPASERKPVSEHPSASPRPPSVRVSSKPAAEPRVTVTRRATLLGIAPVGDPAPTPSVPPPSSPDSGRAKFEAAAQLLEQKRASMAPPKPPAEETTTVDASTAETPAAEPEPTDQHEPAERIPAEAEITATPTAADAKTPLAAEVVPNSTRAPIAEAVDRAPRSRRRSSAPPPRQSRRILPYALAATVFVVMFAAGARRALREPSDVNANATKPVAAVAKAPVRAVVAPPEPPPAAAATSAEPARTTPPPIASESAGEAVATASAEPSPNGEMTRVLVRSAVSGAKFYRYGKQVGMNSVVVELEPGEKRAFEVDLPGYVARKVVVDGSRPEVVVYLPRISEAPAPVQANEAPPATP